MDKVIIKHSNTMEVSEQEITDACNNLISQIELLDPSLDKIRIIFNNVINEQKVAVITNETENEISVYSTSLSVVVNGIEKLEKSLRAFDKIPTNKQLNDQDWLAIHLEIQGSISSIKSKLNLHRKNIEKFMKDFVNVEQETLIVHFDMNNINKVIQSGHEKITWFLQSLKQNPIKEFKAINEKLKLMAKELNHPMIPGWDQDD